MYRASQESMAHTVERLERELAELQGLTGSPRRRMKVLAGVTGASLTLSAFLGLACAATHARAERLQQHMTQAAALLDSRAQDLYTCTALAQEEERAATQCKVDWAERTSQREFPPALQAGRPR
jgi:hypothetical protein